MQEVVLKSRSLHSFEDEEKFWNKYLDVISSLAPRDQRLSPTESTLLSYILAGDPYKSYFKGELSKELKSHFDMKPSLLSRHKSNLAKKGWLSDSEHGLAMISGRLRGVQLKIKEQLNNNSGIGIDMTFSFKLNNGPERS